jgi:hypothetical protein
MDGGLRRLDRTIDLEAAFGASDILEAVAVVGLAEALEVLATTEALEGVLFRTLQRHGIADTFDNLIR